MKALAALRMAVERILEQYSHVEWRTLAVRGERLRSELESAGRTTPETRRHIFTFYEVDDDGRII